MVRVRKHRAWYYDDTDDGEVVREYGYPEDGTTLVWLCDRCAEELGDKVSHASEDSLCDSLCWRCGL